MTRLKPISRRELIGRLKQLGFEGPYAGGNHEFMLRVASGRRLTLPNPQRRKRPPHYRTAQVRNILPRLAQCQTVEDLQALLEEVRKELGFLTLRLRLKAETAPAVLNGIRDLEVRDANPPRDPALVRDDGGPSWTGRAEILSPIRNSQFQRA